MFALSHFYAALPLGSQIMYCTHFVRLSTYTKIENEKLKTSKVDKKVARVSRVTRGPVLDAKIQVARPNDVQTNVP